VLWRCWLGGRKGIQPVNWVVGCWCGYLSGARCRLAYGPADATATHLSLASVKSRLVLPFWYRLTRVVPEKGQLNGCVCACVNTNWKNSRALNAAWALHIQTLSKLCNLIQVPFLAFVFLLYFSKVIQARPRRQRLTSAYNGAETGLLACQMANVLQN